MIAKLKGLLDETGVDWAVIDVSGVGYLVHCSARTLDALGARGDEAVVFDNASGGESSGFFSDAAERVKKMFGNQ